MIHSHEPQLVPIVPSSGLYLTTRGHGDEDRFAKVFLSTWRRIPIASRRRKVRYWRADHNFKLLNLRLPVPPDEDMTDYQSPRIELIWGSTGARLDAIIQPPQKRPKRATDSPRKMVQTVGKCFAACLAEGHVLRFRVGAVEFMPDDVLADLIAHELAHCEQHADGVYGAFGSDWLGVSECERDADTRAGKWGFSIGSIDQWATGVGLAKDLRHLSDSETFSLLLQGVGR